MAQFLLFTFFLKIIIFFLYSHFGYKICKKNSFEYVRQWRHLKYASAVLSGSCIFPQKKLNSNHSFTFHFSFHFPCKVQKTQFSRLSISEADFAIEKNKRWRDNHNSAKKISEAFDHNGNENDGTMRMQIFGSTFKRSSC